MNILTLLGKITTGEANVRGDDSLDNGIRVIDLRHALNCVYVFIDGVLLSEISKV